MTAHVRGGPGRPLPPFLRSSRPTVLLVDSDDEARRAIRTAFDRRGFRVIEARGGAHALRLCECVRGKVDVLITEVAIPEPNGVTLAAAVSVWWPKATVLFMSDGVVAALTHCRGGPRVHAVLPRPVAADELAETTREALAAQ